MTEMIEIVETEGQIVGGQMCPKIIDRFLTGRRPKGTVSKPMKNWFRRLGNLASFFQCSDLLPPTFLLWWCKY